MGDRPKIDLKNGHVGGQPKDWLDRASEPSYLGFKEHALIWCLAVIAVAVLGSLAWGFFRLVLQ